MPSRRDQRKQARLQKKVRKVAFFSKNTVQVWYIFSAKNNYTLFYDGIRYFHIDHTTPCLPPKILHNHRSYHGFGSHLDG